MVESRTGTGTWISGGCDAKTAKIRDFLGKSTHQFVTTESVMDSMRQRGIPEAELKKARARKWARREADRINQQVAQNPSAFQRDVALTPPTE